MGYRYGRVPVEKQVCERPADQCGSIDDDCSLPCNRDFVMGQEFDDSLRSAGHKFLLAGCQPSLIDRVESIDVLVGNYSLNDSILIKAAWEGKLDKDTVDLGIRVQLAQQSLNLVLRRVGWQMVVLGLDSNFFSNLVFPSQFFRVGVFVGAGIVGVQGLDCVLD